MPAPTKDDTADAAPLGEPSPPAAPTSPICAVPSEPKALAKPEGETKPVADDKATTRRRALLDKIARFEERGAILAADAHTLRRQLMDSASSAEWKAVEQRLEQLALSWNPYQDVSADDRSAARKRKRSASSDAQSDAAKQAKEPKRKRNFYELLQLTGDSGEVSAEDIKRQFRKLALRLHPDKQRAAAVNLGDGLAEEQKEERSAPAKLKKVKTDAETGASDDGLSQDSTEFARLVVAYETLSDPARRAAYDAKLADLSAGRDEGNAASGDVVGKDQIKLEASTDFASLEWMARVKHKMDVMDRIAEWAKILGINATEIRFETGEPCVGRGCGKIVSMDRDLECYGSPRRRVYICLLHKYIHACDEACTSRVGDTELDKKVCPMRAYWLVQNWLYDQLQGNLAPAPVNEVKRELVVDEEKTAPQPPQDMVKADGANIAASLPPSEPPSLLVASEIHLGDYHTRFHLEKLSECRRASCAARFRFLEDGIYACRRHGSPHVCTFEQCDRKELAQGRYVCWVSGRVYGSQREEAGTGVRTRKIVYSDANGDENAIDMEVPVMLPIGKMTSYLLEGHQGGGHQDISSLSPPPPDEKAWRTTAPSSPPRGRRPRAEVGDCYDSDEQSPRRVVKRVKMEHETSPVRARIHNRLAKKVEKAEEIAFSIYLKVPAAVANLPRVALELQDSGDLDDEDDDNDGDDEFTNKLPERDMLLPIRVHAKHTVNYIKYYMEGLTEQQISIWDQQVFWGDTLIGEEAQVMVLEEHGIQAGSVLELRLHDDCPLLVSAWNDQSAGGPSSSAAPVEYNTVQISKEAEEDLDDQQEEWENVIAVEEEAFQRDRLERKRDRMEQLGVLHHTEVIQYDGETPRLLGVIPTNRKMPSRQLLKNNASSLETGQGVVKIEQDFIKEGGSDARKRTAMRAMAGEAKPVHTATTTTSRAKNQQGEAVKKEAATE